MSLTTLIKRKRISQAYTDFAAKRLTPPDYRGRQCLVPDHKGPNGLAGIAFDYLARVKMLSEFQGGSAPVHQRPWLSRQIRDSWDSDDDRHSYLIAEEKLWRRHLDSAHAAAERFMEGEGCRSCFMLKVQYMAHADLLYRNSFAFEAYFHPSTGVAGELEALIEIFDPKALFKPRKWIILNPDFPAGENIGGADGDLIVDDMLVDFKTVSRLSVTKAHLIQLVGYKVLEDMGGIKGVSDEKPLSINRLGIYFARYNTLFEIEISELFPNGGYDKFKEIFLQEYAFVESKLLERKREIDAFIARHKERMTKDALAEIQAQ